MKFVVHVTTTARINVIDEEAFNSFKDFIRDFHYYSFVNISAKRDSEDKSLWIVTFKEVCEGEHCPATFTDPEEYSIYPECTEESVEELIESFVVQYDYDIFSNWEVKTEYRSVFNKWER